MRKHCDPRDLEFRKVASGVEETRCQQGRFQVAGHTPRLSLKCWTDSGCDRGRSFLAAAKGEADSIPSGDSGRASGAKRSGQMRRLSLREAVGAERGGQDRHHARVSIRKHLHPLHPVKRLAISMQLTPGWP